MIAKLVADPFHNVLAERIGRRRVGGNLIEPLL
jgi:hypothetical protein